MQTRLGKWYVCVWGAGVACSRNSKEVSMAGVDQGREQ